MRFEEILSFWFEEAGPKRWWKKSDEFDALIKDRFQTIYESARACELFDWRDDPYGRLAEIIVLDQFPRNMFRNTARAFESDMIALVLAQEAVKIGADKGLTVGEKPFLYMPYMHSESLKVHNEAIKVFDQPGIEDNLKFEHRHRDIILRFGRYPHRNEILGRKSTPEEIEFLKQPGSRF